MLRLHITLYRLYWYHYHGTSLLWLIPIAYNDTLLTLPLHMIVYRRIATTYNNISPTLPLDITIHRLDCQLIDDISLLLLLPIMPYHLYYYYIE